MGVTGLMRARPTIEAKEFSIMSIGEICNREVVIAHREDGILEAAKLMRRYHVGDLVVVEDRAGRKVPIGILTDRDIVLEVLAQEVPLDTVTVADVMTYELSTARADETVWATVQRMRVKGLRRMPVVDAEGGLVGIVTADDLLELLAQELADLSRLIAREQVRERESRS
jgi:CBS domain-containing protein